MDPIAPEGAFILGQEGDPELQAVHWEAKIEPLLMLAPNSNGGAMQSRVDALVIVTGYLPADPAFQFAQRHAGRIRRVILSPLGRIAECGAGQQMHRAHLRADQPLNVTTKMRLAGKAPDDPDALVAARTLEGSAVEIRPVVRVQRLRQACNRPGCFDTSLGDP